MPPVRAVPETNSSRYDRTRLENQERAYIAASRRTDRGLNARMQSARRASEIHQKRTGRALRVTETEVLNEALYEEITDVSVQRRRWRAHLHTQSEDFDRKLSAFVTSQLAAHDALDRVVAGTWLEEQRDVAAGFVSPGSLQAASSSPLQMIDMSANNLQYRHYQLGSWGPQSEDYTYQTSMALPSETTLSQQSVSPPDLTWLDTSRRSSLPTSFDVQTFPFPIWPSKSAGSCLTSPMQRADSAIDHQYTTNININIKNNKFRQAPSYNQSLEPTAESLPSLLSPTLPSGNQQIPLGSSSNLGHGTMNPPTTSPRHDFTDRRYSYNPNGKPRSAPSSSVPSPSVPPTSLKSLSFSIQTPASFIK